MGGGGVEFQRHAGPLRPRQGVPSRVAKGRCSPNYARSTELLPPWRARPVGRRLFVIPRPPMESGRLSPGSPLICTKPWRDGTRREEPMAAGLPPRLTRPIKMRGAEKQHLVTQNNDGIRAGAGALIPGRGGLCRARPRIPHPSGEGRASAAEPNSAFPSCSPPSSPLLGGAPPANFVFAVTNSTNSFVVVVPDKLFFSVQPPRFSVRRHRRGRFIGPRCDPGARTAK